MIITSQFSSRCNECRGPIAPGERVVYLGRSVRGVWHAQCHEEGRKVAEAVQASRATDADVAIPAPAGLSYLPFQRAGIAYAMARKSTLIGDEMGLGKTIQAIGVINANPEIRRVLIVTLASLKLNWKRECEKWLARAMTVEVFPKMGGVTVINYEQLGKLSDAETFDLLVCDEAHACKNPEAKRTQLVKALAKRCDRRLFLTGTPVANRPLELWSLLQILAPEEWDPAGRIKNPALKKAKKLSKNGFHVPTEVPEYINVGAGEGAGFFRYAKRYCNAHQEQVARNKFVWNFDGASNLPELQERLRTTVMVRREKADVLKELPPKVRQVIPFEVDAPDVSFDLDGEEFENLAKPGSVAFTEWSSVRQEQGLAKVDAVIEHVRSVLESREKVVVFAHHKAVIARLVEGLAEFGALDITGDTDTSTRDVHVQTFQDGANHCRVLVGSIGAMGTGLTLTASSMVVFAELDPRPYIMAQAEDRCHRIGQRDSVLVQYLVASGTIDERIADILETKVAVIAQVTTTQADYGTPAVPETLQFQSCTCLAAEGEMHADWCDYAGSRVSAEPSPAKPAAEEIPPERVARIHDALRMLAGMCDGACQRDEAGFNKHDATFGRSLAMAARLTPKQAAAGLRILKKYRRQVGDV